MILLRAAGAPESPIAKHKSQISNQLSVVSFQEIANRQSQIPNP
jgi:hypothetical protein